MNHFSKPDPQIKPLKQLTSFYLLVIYYCILIYSICFDRGGKYLVFLSSRSVKMRGSSFLSFEESVFIFQFLNDKMHNYVLFNAFVRFIIQKMKNKHTFLKTEKAKFSQWENLVFSVLRKVCLFFNFSIMKCTNVLNKI